MNVIDEHCRTTMEDEDSLFINNELASYVNEYFWSRIQSCTIRLIYSLHDASREQKPTERKWTLDVREYLP